MLHTKNKIQVQYIAHIFIGMLHAVRRKGSGPEGLSAGLASGKRSWRGCGSCFDFFTSQRMKMAKWLGSKCRVDESQLQKRPALRATDTRACPTHSLGPATACSRCGPMSGRGIASGRQGAQLQRHDMGRIQTVSTPYWEAAAPSCQCRPALASRRHVPTATTDPETAIKAFSEGRIDIQREKPGGLNEWKWMELDGWMDGWILKPELAKNYRASEIWGMVTSAARSSLSLSRLIGGGSTFTPGGTFECQEHYLTPTYYHSNRQQSTKAFKYACVTCCMVYDATKKPAQTNPYVTILFPFIVKAKQKIICVEAGETCRLHPWWPLNPQSELRSASPGRRDEEARPCHSSCTKRQMPCKSHLGSSRLQSLQISKPPVAETQPCRFLRGWMSRLRCYKAYPIL